MNLLPKILILFTDIKKTNEGRASITRFFIYSKHQIMKNFFTYFTPRNRDERESLIGLFCGLAILSIVFYLYSI
jgi:hypothetical protein